MTYFTKSQAHPQLRGQPPPRCRVAAKRDRQRDQQAARAGLGRHRAHARDGDGRQGRTRQRRQPGPERAALRRAHVRRPRLQQLLLLGFVDDSNTPWL